MADATFLFLRPLWLSGLVPLAIGAWWWYRRAASADAWRDVVDPALVPYVIEAPSEARGRGPLWLFGGWALTLVILSGPVWERQEVPVLAARAARVVLFDLSRSMRANDLAPDRATRARYKLDDLLAADPGTRTALIAFAERPYVVSPLSDDAATIAAFVPSLAPEIAPVQGSRPDLAIALGVELLARADVAQGQLVLITDAAPAAADLDAARAARAAGHTLSVLGVGTPGGAPLRDVEGRFLRDADGGIVVPRLDRDALAALARAGGGSAVALGAGDVDVRALLAEGARSLALRDGDEAPTSEHWVERAPWLLPPLALLALGLFRREAAT